MLRLAPVPVLLAGLAVGGALAGCGGSGGTGRRVTTTTVTVTSDRRPVVSEHPSEVVGPPLLSVRGVRVGPEASPPYGVDLDDLPSHYVTADGWMLTPERGPGALPRLAARHLDADAVAALRALASAAGLDVRPAAAPSPPATRDAIELAYRDASGMLSVQRHVTPAPPVQAVLDALARPAEAFGPSHVGADATYEPVAVRYWATAVRGRTSKVPAWPLPSQPLATASDCAAVRDGDAAAVLQAVAAAGASRTANGLVRARWSDGGSLYDVSLRVLLPGESGCPEQAR